MNKNVEELRTILKEYSPFEPAYKGLIDIEVLKGVLDEVDRLNNIINELEKYINETKLEEFENAYGRRYGKTFKQAEVIICNMILNKLQELKGSESNDN